MNTSVIFRAIAKCLILFVVQLMSSLIINAQTPIVGVPCYVNGPSTGSTKDAFVGVLYNPAQGASSLSSGASAVSHLATFGQIGATWGDAYDSRNNSFYAAAALKRHSGYGPNGSGAIYKISADNTATAVSLLIDLDGKTGTLANGSSVVINTGASTDHGNLASLSTPGTDNPAFALAGKTGLGDIDLSPTRNTLWVVNAKGGEVIEVNVSNPASPTVGKVYPVTSSTTGVTAVNGVLRPWGLEIANDGTVYVGVVATAENVTPAAPTTAGPINLSSTTSRESIANRAKLKGYVFKLDKVTGNYTQVLAIDLNYLRGNPGVGINNTAEWVPWFDDYTQGFPNIGDGWFQLYPQPLVADIEIMDDGSMLVSLMDRFGLQTGSEGNSKPGTSATANENGRASGDVVRVVKSGATWSSTLSNRYGDAMSSLENAAALGGIAYKSGTNEFIAVTVDALSASTNGIVVMSQAGTVLDNQDLVTYAANPLLGSKGLALGDVEIGTQGVTAVCVTPTVQMEQIIPTCTGATANNNGAFVVSSITNADRYGISLGATYTGPAYASATSIVTLPDTLKNNIPNTGGTYTIRFFNGADNCIKDTTITVTMVTCAPVKRASLGNYVWFDYNNNGIQDTQEPGVNKAKVYLYKNNVIIDSTVTSTTGYYLFDSLTTGQYQVSVKKSSLPYGYNFTKAFMGADTTKDSNSDTLGYSNKIYLLKKTDLSDTLDLTLDFGIHLDKWDPFGYIYCEQTGAIVKGGHITVNGPAGAVINILADGTKGFYRWETNLDGDYSMTYTNPSGQTLSTTVLPISSTLTAAQIHALDGSSSDKDGTLNGLVRLGSLPNADTTALLNPSTAYNVYFLAGYATVGTPWPTENNFPVTCTVPTTCTPQVLPLCQGESYTLSVPKSGMTGIQWYKDGVAIPAPQGTADTLVVSTVGVYNVTGFQAGAVCKDSSCCPVMVVAGTNCPCSLTASVTQSACNNNGTATWAGDDYFTVTVNASITNGAAGLYEVVFGANADGTGGNVLNSGGTPFGTPVTVGSAGNLKADNQVYSITIRSLGGSVVCFDKKTLTAVQSCASAITCPPVVCTPIGFSKN